MLAANPLPKNPDPSAVIFEISDAALKVEVAEQ
jgi:hypothetical protein